MTDFATQYGKMSREAYLAEMDKKFGVDQPEPMAVAPAKPVATPESKSEVRSAVDAQLEAGTAEKESTEDPSFLRDVGAFLKEVPMQIAGGAMDAVNNTVDAARELGQAAGIPDYVLQITNEAGDFDPMFLSPEETKKKGGLKTGWLPEVKEADTMAGGFTRAITAFAVGFIPASKGLKAAGMTSKAMRAYTAGAVADGLTADPHASRLSTLLNEVPVLQDIVPDYMADNDPANEIMWEGRMKNAIEGLVVGGVGDAVIGGAVKMLKGYKVAKQAKRISDAQPKTVDDMLAEDVAKSAADAKAADDMIADVELDMGPEDVLNETPAGKFEINHMRIKDEKDIQNVLQNMADKEADKLKAGSKTWDETTVASEAEYKQVNDLLGREMDRPFTAAESVAAREILSTSADGLAKMAKLASSPTASPEDLFKFRRGVEVHKSIQGAVFAGRKATAQALNAWKIPTGSTKARAQGIAAILESSGGSARKMAKMIDSIGDAGGNVSGALGKITSKNWSDAHYQVWINGLLSAPSTHMANVIGNTGTTMMSIPERYITAGFDALKGQGGHSFIEANARATGFFSGLKDGMSLMTGKKTNSVLEASMKTEARMDAISAEAWGKAPDDLMGKGLDYIGKAIGMPSWALEKGDLFFKGLNYRMMLNEQATKEALTEGLTGKAFKERVADLIQNPTNPIHDVSTDFARYQTFTNETGKFAKSVGSAVEATGVGKYIMPFIRTPANILSYGFERTPMALVMSDVRNAIKAGGTEASTAMARIAGGTVLMASMTPFIMDGKITGGGPSNPAERSALEQTGWQAYSVKLGDKYFSYERLEPLATLIGYSADIGSIMGQAGEDEAGELVAAGTAAMFRNMTNKTFLSGMAKLVDVVNSGSPAKWTNYINQMGAGMIQPVGSSAMRKVNSYFDTTVRDYRPDDENGFLKSMFLRAQETVPGLGTKAPALRDVWGDELSYNHGVAPSLAAISPIKIKKVDNDPVNALIAKNQIPLTMPVRRIQGVKLTNKQYSKYTEIAGKMAKEELDTAYRLGEFDGATGGPEGEINMIVDMIISQARQNARGIMMMDDINLANSIEEAQLDKERKLLGE